MHSEFLTRARQDLVVFVPEASHEDHTRPPGTYNVIYTILRACGFHDLPADL